MEKSKKPFGLSLACKIAASALRSSAVPASVVLSRLFLLAKSSEFPQILDEGFFSVPASPVDEAEKKEISKTLSELRGPHVETEAFLEAKIASFWKTKKRQEQRPESTRPIQARTKPSGKTKPVAKASKPVVIVRKQKRI